MPCDKGCQPDWHRDDCAIYTSVPTARTPEDGALQSGEPNANPRAWEGMRVLVTGSRDWIDDCSVEDVLSEVESARRTPGAPFVVVHGACPTGADLYASRWVAEWRGYPGEGREYVTEEPHPADWSRGRRAGPERNAYMVSLGADLCLAFIGPCTSPRCNIEGIHDSHGATGCADLAERAGIPTRRLWYGDLYIGDGLS